jgi:uncharacterized protein (DUF952 family)
VSVVFHIATGRDWERATSTGIYSTESMHSHGLIGCFTPAQHAAAADNLYAGRTDLVPVLIDTDRLQSEFRLEQADAHGQPVPCVDGPVNLDAVFEAAPYRPGADGRFHPHEEASGFAVHGAATLDQTRRRAVEVMAGYRRPWWVAGGWALDPGAQLPRCSADAGPGRVLGEEMPSIQLGGRAANRQQLGVRAPLDWATRSRARIWSAASMVDSRG